MLEKRWIGIKGKSSSDEVRMRFMGIFMLLLFASWMVAAQEIPMHMKDFHSKMNNDINTGNQLQLEGMKTFAALPKENRDVLKKFWRRNPGQGSCLTCSDIIVIGGPPIVISPLPIPVCAKNQQEGMVLVSREWLNQLMAKAQYNQSVELPR